MKKSYMIKKYILEVIQKRLEKQQLKRNVKIEYLIPLLIFFV
ncbi:hypothetical protein [Romboutsia hominis]|nr:hypothetical protein [Romboutsia hominis]MDB8801336.1 hypothetical protein [Romboutsia sp. 1001216sp1]